jgi:hypothetical protein
VGHGVLRTARERLERFRGLPHEGGDGRTAVWVVPVVLFAPEALGTFSFDAGLAMLVGSAANIHHFILDGVIWKLRSRPVARVLL